MLAAAVDDRVVEALERDGAGRIGAAGCLRLDRRGQGQQEARHRGGREGRQSGEGGGAKRFMMRFIMSSSGQFTGCRRSEGQVSGEMPDSEAGTRVSCPLYTICWSIAEIAGNLKPGHDLKSSRPCRWLRFDIIPQKSTVRMKHLPETRRRIQLHTGGIFRDQHQNNNRNNIREHGKHLSRNLYADALQVQLQN